MTANMTPSPLSSPSQIFNMDYQDALALLVTVRDMAIVQFHRIPGSAILTRYIKMSYQHDPARSVIELCLVIFAIQYLLAPKYSTQKKNFVKLRPDEVDELIEDWTPEPLVAPLTEFEQEQIDKTPVIAGPTGTKVKLTNGRTVTNLASTNFFNLANQPALAESAITTLRTYGVGPCGPPGFYGTQDVHVDCEQDIAEFIGSEACIIYAQAFSTISAVIPAFAKRGDIIVVDEKVNFATQKALQLSRSTIRWYKHNDMDDLEKVLKKVEREFRGRELTRRFIVTEALFEDGGDVADLGTIVKLKFQYKYRLILDETNSFGVVGETGRGLTEYYNLPATDVDMIVGTLATTFVGGGGFCCGSKEIVHHQRISGLAYVFSAALPAMLATTVSEVIKMLRENPENFITPLRENIKTFHAALAKTDTLTITSSLVNPAISIQLNGKREMSDNEQDRLAQDVVDECLANGVLVTRVKRIALPAGMSKGPKWFGWNPAMVIKVYVSSGFSKKDCEKAGSVIRSAVTKVVGRKR
ncbi:serine palmitoyltransferase component [Orbilia oligospora]|uniref:serine C-palmitoyltransferase n=1 Tax=Orbilia oligospora TaxID=2813651 RepID=A0A7C8U338_ORBOL|nr:serine palmitoyltransferase component [Orbilia oligospora]